MSDLKLVLYKENRSPRSIALSTRMLYKTLFLATVVGLLLLLTTGLALKFYFLSRAKTSQATSTTSNIMDGMGPTNTLEDQNQSLRDEVDQLKAKLANIAVVQGAPKEIDKKNPALALFSPVVVDRTQGQDQVVIAAIKASKGKPTSLTFELHNAHEGQSTEKGYIVVRARTETGLQAYPNIFNKSGPFLLDFEKGETFQVARFRMVNAQFEAPADHFQILIFTRKGELLINTMYEAK
jgi:hypothetical protein